MAGQVVRVIPRTTLKISSSVGQGQTQILASVGRIDTSQYKEGTLMVRLHSLSVTNSPAVTVTVKSDGYTAEDPGQDFIESTELASITKTGLTDATAPYFETKDLLAGTQALGGMAYVEVEGTQASSAAEQTIELSVDIALKE